MFKDSTRFDDEGPLTHASAESGASPGPAVICFPFAGGTVGGSQVSAVKLIERLDRHHFQPLLVLHHGDGELAAYLAERRVAFEVLPVRHFLGSSRGINNGHGLSSLAHGVAAQPALADFLRRRQVQIVHTNEGAMHLSWALPARLAGAKLLWHHRGAPEARGVRFLAPLVADHVAAVSHFALSQAGAVERRGRASVIYSPFDTDLPQIDKASAHAVLASELGVAADTRIIGFFGNLVERKRPLMFAEMLAELTRLLPDTPLVGAMFGSTLVSGMDNTVTGRAAALGIADRFRLMGFRTPVEPLIAGCDVHAIPAIDEPFGRSLIESMLLETPVVAAASGGNIEAIENDVTGILTEPDDPAAMAAAIAGLLRDPRRAQSIATRARQEALASYGTHRHVAQVSEVYHRLLASG